jgi:hypothetical protein
MPPVALALKPFDLLTALAAELFPIGAETP